MSHCITLSGDSLRRVVAFTNSSHDFVAIEPVSPINNAVNLLDAGSDHAGDLGIRVLAPGESMSAQMSIMTERVG